MAPFPGATTGTGGRIRDVQAAGRGAHVIAGTAGYSFGNLNIPGANSSKAYNVQKYLSIIPNMLKLYDIVHIVEALHEMF